MIQKMLTCSTAHVTEAEAKNFDRCAFGQGRDDQDNLLGVTLWHCQYGWMFHIGDWEDDPVTEEIAAQMGRPMPSKGLVGAIEYARSQGCDFIRFDNAYETIPGVETYDW